MSCLTHPVDQRVRSLKPLPQTARVLIEEVRSDNPNLNRIKQAFSTEPALSGALLRLANSSFFGIQTRVTTIERAILLLGTRSVRDLIIGLSLADSVFQNPDPKLVDLWKQILVRSVLVKTLSEKLKICDPGELFVVSILSGLGHMIAAMEQIDSATTLLEEECQEITRSILRHWRLPEEICVLTEYFMKAESEPLEAGELSVDHLIQWAQILTTLLGYKPAQGMDILDEQVLRAHAEQPHFVTACNAVVNELRTECDALAEAINVSVEHRFAPPNGADANPEHANNDARHLVGLEIKDPLLKLLVGLQVCATQSTPINYWGKRNDSLEVHWVITEEMIEQQHAAIGSSVNHSLSAEWQTWLIENLTRKRNEMMM